MKATDKSEKSDKKGLKINISYVMGFWTITGIVLETHNSIIVPQP